MDHPIAMFEDRPYKRTFYSAPQSVTSLLAAFMEPAITVITFLGANLYLDAMVGRPELVLCLLVFALTFPGRNRFRQNMVAAGVDIISSWVVLIGVLLLCGYVTRSIDYFEQTAVVTWIFLTPVAQWGAVWVGRRLVRRQAALPEAR
ncbi:MAG: undecaprenyl-phosphate glucose phosphotransferase, partial [Rhizobacter sp.]|nr:undecaprenyl-phosphate glucose phosphotransferase [Rhizobacter sp.]